MSKPEPFAPLGGHFDDHAPTGTPETNADPRLMWPNKRKRKIVYVPQPTPMEKFSMKHLTVAQLCEQRSCEMMLVNRLKEEQRSCEMMLVNRLKEEQRSCEMMLVNRLKEEQRSCEMMLVNRLKEEQRSCEMMLVNRLKEEQRSHQAKKHGAKDLADLDDASSSGVLTSNEDLEALKLLSVLKKMSALEEGNVVLDLPLFGVLEGIFLTGIIGRLHFNRQRELVLSETKTLNKDDQLFASDSQEDEFQVGLHKLLFESMVSGQVKGDQYMKHLHLQPEQTLGPEVRCQAQSLGCPSNTLRELVGHLLTTVASSKIKRVDRLQVIYHVKGRKIQSSFGTMQIQSKEGQLRDQVRGYLAYWKGQREPRGLDIEDAWKCGICPYKEDCEWKNNELVEARMKCGVPLNSFMLDCLRPTSPITDTDAYVCDIFQSLDASELDSSSSDVESDMTESDSHPSDFAVEDPDCCVFYDPLCPDDW